MGMRTTSSGERVETQRAGNTYEAKIRADLEGRWNWPLILNALWFNTHTVRNARIWLPNQMFAWLPKGAFISLAGSSDRDSLRDPRTIEEAESHNVLHYLGRPTDAKFHIFWADYGCTMDCKGSSSFVRLCQLFCLTCDVERLGPGCFWFSSLIVAQHRGRL